ncbi:hypothetical protein ACQU0X_08520 [Pseudovibrio ascidiaceicola]|uniref:hypothetical protein n=1 Tax=Pseudovibrio ascidiaceicola TaxID=285279 RepID=UPI003D36F185
MEGLQFDENGMLVAPSGATEGEAPSSSPQNEGGFLNTAGTVASEAASAVVGGVGDGLNEMAETAQWALMTPARAASDLLVGGMKQLTGGHSLYYTNEEGFGWMTDEEVRQGGYTAPAALEYLDDITTNKQQLLEIKGLPENDTAAGQMARSTVQFLASYGMIGKAASGLKAVSSLNAAQKGATLGMATDFAAFDAHEDRFSDFLQDNFEIRNAVTDYLAADDEDSMLEGKLKNTLEGIGLGVATEGVFRMAKLFKQAKRVQVEQGDEAAATAMNEGLAEMAEKEPELFEQLELFDDVSNPNTSDVAQGAGKKLADPKKPKGGKAAEQPAEAVAEVTKQNQKEAGVGKRKQKVVDTSGFTVAMDKEISLRRAGLEADPDREVKGVLFNFDKMDSDVDIKDVMNMTANDVVKAGIKDKTTFEAIVKDANKFLTDATDISPEIIAQSLARQAKDAQKQQGLVIAGKALMQSLSREVELLAVKISNGKATDIDFEKFNRFEQRLMEVTGNLKSVITGAAQTTSAGNIRTADWVTGQQLNTQDILQNRLTNTVDQKAIRERAKAIRLSKEAGGGVNNMLKIVKTRTQPVTRALNEVFINSILSGPKTHMINIMSNAFNAALLPAEKFMGGALGGNPEMMREAFRQYQGMSMALKDSLKLTATAFRQNRNILDPEAAILEVNGVSQHAIRSESENPIIRLAVNAVGTGVRVPTRALMAGDELFKQLNYRSSVYARLSVQAADLVKAGKITQKDAARYIADRMDASVNAKGGANSQIDLDHAREATFTQELRQGSMFADFQKFTNRHPLTKFIVPFIRTPTNVMRHALHRTPLLNSLSKTFKAELRSGDPRRVAMARGKMATGALFWGTAITAAYEGKITGSGPADPTLKARMMETGWRPYSVVTDDGNGGKKYVEYKRMEPFATFFGIAADVADIGGSVGESEAEEIGTAAIVAFVNNVGSKTFLQGITDFAEAVGDPDRHLGTYLRRQASNMVPYTALQREVRKGIDPSMREARTLVDTVKNNIPSYSSTLPPRRSWITGDPLVYPKGWGADMVSPVGEAFASINPIIAADGANDPVLDEMAQLNFAFTAPVRRLEGGIELNTAQYSRLLELHGKVRIGRDNMYQALAKAMDSKIYDKERNGYADTTEPSENPRVKIVQRIIERYRSKARKELIMENPDLLSQKRESFNRQNESARAVYSGIADLAN